MRKQANLFNEVIFHESLLKTDYLNPVSIGFSQTKVKDCSFSDSHILFFENSELENCQFLNAQYKVVLKDCELKDCDFTQAQFLELTFINTVPKNCLGLPPLESSPPQPERKIYTCLRG